MSDSLGLGLDIIFESVRKSAVSMSDIRKIKIEASLFLRMNKIIEIRPIVTYIGTPQPRLEINAKLFENPTMFID